MRYFKLFIITIFLFETTGLRAQYSDTIRLNDLRILASHNSYKKLPDDRVLKFLCTHKKMLGTENDPIQLEYGHVPLTEQLDSFGIRGFELDINYDPKGGRYYKRSINGFVRGVKKRSQIQELKEPGFKIIHITDVDYLTNYITFKSALEELNSWSKAHPNHLPIFVNIEAKGDGIGDYSKISRLFGFKTSIPFDSTAFSALDDEIYMSIDSNSLFTPQDLRGNYSTIKDRLTSEGWPALNECTGKIIFILQGSNSHLYTEFIDANQPRPMFAYGSVGAQSTAFVVRNEPISQAEEIDSLTDTYIVRTRSDAGTFEAREEDYTRWKEALKSNAQIISTDYYQPNLEFSDFFVKMPFELMLRGMMLNL